MKYFLKIILVFVITFIINNNLFSQARAYPPIAYPRGDTLQGEEITINEESTATDPYPIAIGAAIFLYVLNPIFLFENDKFSGGITKEFTVGFGEIMQHRIGLEYSFLFRKNQNHHLRFSYKYDYLFDDLVPSNNLQTTMVLSVGGGFFTDFDGTGVFPEVAYGFSIRNHKLLFYPHIKVRYTRMLQERKSDIYDLSFGVIVGIGNPFVDLKIRRTGHGR